MQQNGHSNVGMNIRLHFRLLLNGQEQDFSELGTKSQVMREVKSSMV